MKAFRPLLSLLCISLFMVAGMSSSAQAPPANGAELQLMQQKLDALQAQVVELQNQIKALIAAPAISAPEATGQHLAASMSNQEQKAEPAKELNTGEPVKKATAQYETDSEDQLAAARLDNAPLDPKYPNYFRLPGTRTFMRFGGYAKSDFIFDPRPAGDQDRFIPSSMPVPPAANISNSTVSVRPSRINFDFLVPMEQRTLRFFLEMDFFGSSSTTPRLRHAYAQGRNLLVGQTFSNFMDPDAAPDTLDFQGPNSQVLIRNPQGRFTWKVAEGTTISISAEKPSSDVAFETPEFSAQPNSPAPDGTVQIRHEMDFGHVQLAALFRDISAFLPDGRSDSVFGWGFNLAGLFKTFGKDNFVYQGAYGNGISRYMNDTSGLGIDAAVISAQDPRLEAIPAIGIYGGYQHYWVNKLRSSIVYGFTQTQNTAAQSNSTFHRSDYTALNLIWNPLTPLHFGTEFLYGRLELKDGSVGTAPRVQVSVKYNFMQMKSSK